MNNLEDYDFNEVISLSFASEVTQGYEKFWSNNQLGYNKDGEIIRTKEVRVRPKAFHDFHFGRKEAIDKINLYNEKKKQQ
jgi:hypothetical protein